MKYLPNGVWGKIEINSPIQIIFSLFPDSPSPRIHPPPRKYSRPGNTPDQEIFRSRKYSCPGNTHTQKILPPRIYSTPGNIPPRKYSHRSHTGCILMMNGGYIP